MAHALSPVMLRLVGTLEGVLSETDVRQIRELIQANQPGLALEWITDSITQTGNTDASLRQLLVQLGTQLGIAPSIRQRLR